jgi:hypothetical protein
MRISILDIEELACEMVGLDYDKIDADTEVIEEAFIEKYEIDLSQFVSLMNDLTPRIAVSKSELTDEVYKGFINNNKDMWLFKTKCMLNDK